MRLVLNDVQYHGRSHRVQTIQKNDLLPADWLVTSDALLAVLFPCAITLALV